MTHNGKREAHRFALTTRMITAAAGIALAACSPAPDQAPSSGAPLTLQPFGPRSITFDAPQGRAHNDYLFVEQPRRTDPAWRATLTSALTSWPQPASGPWALRSVYVYERTARIGPQFQGDADALRGVHDQDLVAYARWTAGKLETAWVINQGQVFFDLLLDRPVTPSFEFD